MSEYNGWTNYETWLVNLHVSNTQSTSLHADAMARQAMLAEPVYDFQTKAHIVSIELRKRYAAWIEEMVAIPADGSLSADLLGAALAHVNWREITDHLLEAVKA